MPEFPRYQSQGQLTTQTPSVQAPENTDGQVLEKVGQVAQNATENAIKWSNAVDTIQTTTAKNNFKNGILDIENRAQNDPNYNNSDQYFKEIEKLKTDSLKGFSNESAKSQAAIDLGYEGSVSQIKIQNLYKKKMIDVGQASTMSLIDSEVNNPSENSLLNIQKLLNQQVSAGILDHKDAYTMLRKANEDLGVNRINKDLYLAQTPEQVDAVTQGITSGAYEKGGVTIDPSKKKSLLDIAESARKNTEKKIEAQQIEAQTQNRMDTVTSIASGKTPIEDINIPEIAQYDPQLAGTLTKVKDFMVNYNPKLPPKEQALSSAGLLNTQQVLQMKNYARSITDVFMQDDNKQLSDFVLRELEKKGDGLTPSVKIAAFANLAALKAKVNNQQSAPDAETADKFFAIKNAVKFLEASNPYLAARTIGDFVVKNYLSGTKGHKQIMNEARSVLRDNIIGIHKSVAKLPSVPNKIVDGEASVEDLQSGTNELKDGFNGSYADSNSD